MDLSPPPTEDPSPEPLHPPEVPVERPALVLRGTALARRISPRVLRYGLLGLGAAIVLVGFAWNRCGFRGCPDVAHLSSYRPGGAPVLLDRHGVAIGDLSPVEGELVTLKSLPAHVPDAFMAVEDQRFRSHGAVDFPRVAAATLANLKARGVEQGFSTLTMQLARNVFPDQLPANRRTLSRKLLEVRVAQEIEGTFTKDEILEMYLNHIYFGHGARGIEAAARHYFGTGAGELDVAQAAMLAALPKAPTHYDPRARPQRAKERRDLVITLMERQGRLPPETARQARDQPVRLAAKTASAPSAALAGWFAEEVRRQVEEVLGPDVYDEKLRVHTTLDAEMQKAAHEELLRQLEAVEQGELGRFSGPAYGVMASENDEVTPYLQGAVVALEVGTGDVLAWVGGRDFGQSRFDRVRDARRQAGSAFKPFVYAAALNAGRMMSQTLDDEPLRMPMDRRTVWEPKNFDGAYEGRVTLRDALVRSKNVPTVRLATDVGYDLVARLAEESGLSDVPRQPSMALGTVSVSPLELAAAYTTFAGLGQTVRPRVVLKVERESGEVLWEATPPSPRRVLSPAVAYIVTDALRDALSRGTGTAVGRSGFRAPAAGKTGTTNDGTDAWFVGYTPEVVAAVWIGFDRQRPIMPRATGGRLAAPVWGRMMLRVHPPRSSAPDWSRPSDVLEGRVDPASGLLLSAGCRPPEGIARRELFLRTIAPPTSCPSEGEAQFMEASLDTEIPDYEEGLQTGLPSEQLPASEAAAADQPRFYTPSAAEPAPAEPGPNAEAAEGEPPVLEPDPIPPPR